MVFVRSVIMSAQCHHVNRCCIDVHVAGQDVVFRHAYRFGIQIDVTVPASVLSLRQLIHSFKISLACLKCEHHM